MNDLMKSMLGNVSEKALKEIGKNFNLDPSKTKDSMQGVASVLLNQVTQKVSSNKNSADSLNKALDKTDDFSILGNITSLLSPEKEKDNKSMLDGLIEKGKNQIMIQQVITKTGMSKEMATKLVTFVAPLFMAGLAKIKKKTNLDATGLTNLLQMANLGNSENKSIGGKIQSAMGMFKIAKGFFRK
jgi:hypothetical protein